MKLLSRIKGKKSVFRNVAIFFCLQFAFLMILSMETKAATYATADRYYSVETKATANTNGYTKLTIDQTSKTLNVYFYRENYNAFGVYYRKNGAGSYESFTWTKDSSSSGALCKGNVSLASLADGEYEVSIWYNFQGESEYTQNQFFHVVVQNGSPFFVKDFAYKLAEKQLDVVKQLENNSKLTDTTYLGTSITSMKTTADRVISGCSNDYKKCEALYQWVMEHMTYVENTVENEAVDAYNTGKGVCFGYANLLTAMLRLEGIPAVTITGGVFNQGNYFTYEPSDYYSGSDMGAHAWTLCYFDGKWHYLDPTWDDEFTTRNWFDLTIEQMALNRTNLKLYDTFTYGNYLFTYDNAQLAVSAYLGSGETIVVPSEFLGKK